MKNHNLMNMNITASIGWLCTLISQILQVHICKLLLIALLTWRFFYKITFHSTSPVETDPAKAFSRDGFGRKSVSEKRKVQTNPRLAPLYQQSQSTHGNQSNLMVLWCHSVCTQRSQQQLGRSSLRPMMSNKNKINYDYIKHG